MENFPSWADHLLAILVGCIIPAVSTYQSSKTETLQYLTSKQKKSFYIAGSLNLFFITFIVVGVWLLYRRPLEELGFRKPGEDISYWWFVLAFVVLYAIDTTISILTRSNREETVKLWKKRTPFLPTRRKELSPYILLCFSAGVFEEIIYRGFLVNYCYYLFPITSQRELWAVVFPAIVFSLAHFYQGSRAVIKIFILSLLFGFIFIKSGSLLVVMVLHFLVNFAGGLLTVRYMKGEAEGV